MIESGRASLSLESVSLCDVISGCQAMMEPQAQQLGIRMAFPKSDGAAPAFVDAGFFRYLTKPTEVNELLVSASAANWPYNIGSVGSINASGWFSVRNATNRPLSCRYVFFCLWTGEPSADPPAVREIRWRTDP